MREKLSSALSLVTLAFVLVGCSEENRFKLPTESEDSFVKLTAGEPTLPADGLSTLALVARITPQSTLREIKFTTTAGSLVGAESGKPRELTVSIDSVGAATAVLRSSAEVVTAVVTAQVVNAPEVTDTLEIPFLPVNPDSIIRFVAAPTSAPADGATASAFTVEIAASLSGGDRTVTFMTNAGSFSPDNSMLDMIMVPASGDNTATALLYSPQTTGVGQLVAKVKDVSRNALIEFLPVDPDSIIRFVAAPTSAPADGATVSAFTVEIAATLSGGDRTVEFTTSAGSFSPDNPMLGTITVPASGDNTATALLYSPQTTGVGQLLAKVKNISRNALITFETALPEGITVILNKFQVQDKLDDQIVVTAILRRRIGIVTMGTVATFEARDQSDQLFGVFRNVRTSNQIGEAQAEFSPAGSGRLGLATMIVGADGTELTETATFEVVAAE